MASPPESVVLTCGVLWHMVLWCLRRRQKLQHIWCLVRVMLNSGQDYSTWLLLHQLLKVRLSKRYHDASTKDHTLEGLSKEILGWTKSNRAFKIRLCTLKMSTASQTDAPKLQHCSNRHVWHIFSSWLSWRAPGPDWDVRDEGEPSNRSWHTTWGWTSTGGAQNDKIQGSNGVYIFLKHELDTMQEQSSWA